MRQKLKAALRKVSKTTAVRDFIKKVRVKNRGPESFKYRVRCVNCDHSDGISVRYKPTLKDGRKSKKERLWYQVDHVDGLPVLDTLDDLSAYAKALFFGPMQILCIPCHKEKTKKERKK